MARVRKLNGARDGDAILSLSSDDGGGMYVVPGGKRAYIVAHYNFGHVCFSGEKTLRALAKAILTALKK